MHRGYIKVWRKTIDTGMLKNHKLWAFWSWCLLKASHKDTTVMVGYQEVKLQAGQFIFGRNNAAIEIGLTQQEVRTCLKNLEKMKNLTIKPTNKFSIISIVKWDIYQQDNYELNQQLNQQLTNKEPTTNQQLTTNKNDKHNKNEKNIPPNPQDLTVYLKKQADGLGLGAFVQNLVGFLNYRKEMGEQIKQKGGIDFILKQALEIKNAGFDVDYFINEAMQKGDKWFFLEKYNGKSTKKTEEVGNYIDPMHFLPPAEKERILQEKYKALMQ